ncbi:MAG: hypothetical protein K2G55_06510 [Lachnospiraceae bacterium]|nr:hypothetical protein [Lachnospiraceae bacterium]
MTKAEYVKCEKLMYDAIKKAKQSNKEYETYNQLVNEDTVKGNTELRKADQHFGYAEGINQVLVTLGFSHDKMKELSDLL